MKLKASREAFLEPLQAVIGVVERRTQQRSREFAVGPVGSRQRIDRRRLLRRRRCRSGRIRLGRRRRCRVGGVVSVRRLPDDRRRRLIRRRARADLPESLCKFCRRIRPARRVFRATQ